MAESSWKQVVKDFEKVEASRPHAVPAGQYRLRIDGLESQPARKEKKPFIRLSATVSAGPYTGRPVLLKPFFLTGPALGFLDRFLKKLDYAGVQSFNNEGELSQLVGIEFDCMLKTDDGFGVACNVIVSPSVSRVYDPDLQSFPEDMA